MNVYDFDGTIFYTDSTIKFAFWCMHRHPKLYFTYFPKVMFNLAKYKKGSIQNYLMQRKLYSYLTMVDDFDVQIEKFWDKYEKRISAWYLAQKRPDDLIISASPICVIEPIARRLGVQFMATDYDREFGVFIDNLMYEHIAVIVNPGANDYEQSLHGTPGEVIYSFGAKPSLKENTVKICGKSVVFVSLP